MLSSAPGTMATARPAASSSEASSVAPWMPARCARQQGVEPEGLRGLGAEQAVARHRRDDDAVAAALQRVRDREGRDGARASAPARASRAGDGAGGDAGAGGVVHQHDVGRVRHQRLQPGAHAVLAGGAAGDRRAGGRCRPGRPRSARRRRPAGGAATAAASASAAWRITGLPASGEKLLRRVGAEAAAGAGGDQDGGDAHGRALSRRRGGVNSVERHGRCVPRSPDLE